jgi:NTP pyrophosphatase (non-canonical NTP hydrolase)
MSKSLKEMAAEVHENNVAKGWYNEQRSFGEMIALLHSEASEALEAYREWGLTDMTGTGPSLSKGIMDPDTNTCVPKPEGVGSEYADVLIRLLDDAYRNGINLEAEYERKMRYNRLRPWRHGGKTL